MNELHIIELFCLVDEFTKRYIFTTEFHLVDFPAIAHRAGQSTADYRREKSHQPRPKGGGTVE